MVQEVEVTIIELNQIQLLNVCFVELLMLQCCVEFTTQHTNVGKQLQNLINIRDVELAEAYIAQDILIMRTVYAQQHNVVLKLAIHIYFVMMP